MTCSIPDALGERTGDGRFSLMRDAGLYVRAMVRVGMAGSLDNYLGFLKNHVFRYIRQKSAFPPYSTILIQRG